MQGTPNPGRRAFITAGCVAGVGATVLTPVRAQTAVEECKGSVADALLLFEEILLDVQGVALTNAVQPVLDAGRECADSLETLTKLLDRLQKEICKPASSGPTTRMQKLVEEGGANAKILKASISSASEKEAALMIGMMSSLARDISEAAEDVQQECVLTPTGKTILLEIFSTVEKVRKVPANVRIVQEKYSETAQKIICRVKAVRQRIMAAATAVTRKDEKDVAVTRKAEKDVTDHIDAAVCLLHLLDDNAIDPKTRTATTIQPPQAFRITGHGEPNKAVTLPACDQADVCTPDYNPVPAGRPAQVLMNLLRGAEKVFKNPAAGVFQVAEFNPQGSQARLVAASYSGATALPADVGELLGLYCKPYTTWRRVAVTTAVGVARSVTAANSQDRINAINWIVYKLKCDEPSNRPELVRRLAA